MCGKTNIWGQGEGRDFETGGPFSEPTESFIQNSRHLKSFPAHFHTALPSSLEDTVSQCDAQALVSASLSGCSDVGLGSWVIGNKASFTNRDKKERTCARGKESAQSLTEFGPERWRGRVGSVWVQVKSKRPACTWHIGAARREDLHLLP